MLKFLIVILCIFFILRTLSRMFVVSSFNAINKRMQDEMFKQRGNTYQRPEGQVTIDPGSKKGSKGNDDGDYVDYEEVK